MQKRSVLSILGKYSSVNNMTQDQLLSKAGIGDWNRDLPGITREINYFFLGGDNAISEEEVTAAIRTDGARAKDIEELVKKRVKAIEKRAEA